MWKLPLTCYVHQIKFLVFDVITYFEHLIIIEDNNMADFSREYERNYCQEV